MNSPTAPLPHPRGPTRATVPDVVAGLVNQGSAYSVARAAVQAAAVRGARVRFLQIPPPGLSEEDRHEVDRTTFREALRAMHGLRRVACSFELVDGDPVEVLLRSSSGAALLVLGRDSEEPGHDVAERVLRDAGCDVLTVASA